MRQWNGQYSTWGNFHTYGTCHYRVTKHIPISAAKNIYIALSSVLLQQKIYLVISELQINMLEITNYTKLE